MGHDFESEQSKRIDRRGQDRAIGRRGGARALCAAAALVSVGSIAARAHAQSAARLEANPLPPCARPTNVQAAAIVNPRAEGERLLLAIEAHRLRAMSLLAAARRARDIVRVQCVFDRTTQLESLQTLGREGFLSLEDAVVLRDRRRSEHSLRVLQIYQQRAAVLASESAQCATPARRLPPAETVVTVRAPPSMTELDE